MAETKTKEKLAKIKVLNGGKTALVEEFETTYYTVRRSLNGEIHSDESIQIREAALKLGGEIVDEKLDKNTNRIKVYGGERAFLVKKFSTTYYTVAMALSGKTKTLLSYQIRETALQLGGKEIIPEEEIEQTKITIGKNI